MTSKVERFGDRIPCNKRQQCHCGPWQDSVQILARLQAAASSAGFDVPRAVADLNPATALSVESIRAIDQGYSVFAIPVKRRSAASKARKALWYRAPVVRSWVQVRQSSRAPGPKIRHYCPCRRFGQRAQLAGARFGPAPPVRSSRPMQMLFSAAERSEIHRLS